MLYRYCLPELNFDEGAAADCVHAAFDIAEARYEKLIQRPNLRGFLFKTVKNMVHHHRRDNRRVYVASLDFIASIPDPCNPFDAIELTNADIERISGEVLSCLRPEERELHRLYYVENRSYADIAKAFGVSEKAIRARLARLKVKLKEKIIYFS